MNRSGGFQGSLLQQQMARESSCWWTSNSMKSNNGEASSSSPLHHLMQISNSLSLNSLYESQELPQSWSQMLLGGLVGEEESYSLGTPRSCVTSSLSCSMLDFSNSKPDRRQLPIDHLSECNSIEAGATLKKARIHGTSSSQSTSFKVRKEKLGDRITVLHQLVSPFGKTDTASVLLEAIGYIRFLQSQIEALSSPYLTAVSVKKRHTLLNDSCMKRCPSDHQDGYTKPKMDLRSRGLCLVPISCTLHVGNEDGVDY